MARRPERAPRTRSAVRFALLLVLSGCAALPWPTPARPRGELRVGADWLDLRGAVHVHTQASHDSPGRLEDLVRGAQRAGLAWVALTEHTEPGLPPAAGMRDGVLLIPGFELRGWGGSLLALGVAELPAERRELPAALARIRAQGGLAVAGHLESAELSELRRPEQLPDALELDNLHASTSAANRALLALRVLFLPPPWAARGLLRTPWENLATWEQLPDTDAIVGAVDAHAKLRPLGPLGPTLDSYARTFRLLTTHVLARENTPEAILEALRAARSYVAYEGLSRVDRFRFERFGDAYTLEAPERARLALVCDGGRHEQADELTAVFSIPPGSRRCRGEAWLGRRLWIATSYQRVERPQPGSRP